MILISLRLVCVFGLLLGFSSAALADDPPLNSQASPEKRAEPQDDQKQVDQKQVDQKQVEGKKPQKKKHSGKYIRVRRDEAGQPLALETPVIRFVSADDKKSGISVDLIGAVHVGERTYYQQLNKLFQDYDALLYELVARENAIPQPNESAGANPVRGLQVGLKSLLDLEFQLDEIDYKQENFVHADMSPSEFAKSMKNRGESFLQMYFRMLGQSIAQQSKDPTSSNDLALLMALFAPDRSIRMKRLMAEQFTMMDGQLDALNGKDGSTIITERNKKALHVLRRELDGGKKRLGIFYGAGHLADMEQRLIKEFGMKRDEIKWITAWSLKPKTRRAKPADK